MALLGNEGTVRGWGLVGGSEEHALGDDTVILGCPLMNSVVPPMAPFHDGLPCH